MTILTYHDLLEQVLTHMTSANLRPKIETHVRILAPHDKVRIDECCFVFFPCCDFQRVQRHCWLLTKYCYDVRGPSVVIVWHIRGLVLARRRVKVSREMRATAELSSISRWGGGEADSVKNDPWLRSHIC